MRSGLWHWRLAVRSVATVCCVMIGCERRTGQKTRVVSPLEEIASEHGMHNLCLANVGDSETLISLQVGASPLYFGPVSPDAGQSVMVFFPALVSGEKLRIICYHPDADRGTQRNWKLTADVSSRSQALLLEFSSESGKLIDITRAVQLDEECPAYGTRVIAESK